MPRNRSEWLVLTLRIHALTCPFFATTVDIDAKSIAEKFVDWITRAGVAPSIISKRNAHWVRRIGLSGDERLNCRSQHEASRGSGQKTLMRRLLTLALAAIFLEGQLGDFAERQSTESWNSCDTGSRADVALRTEQ